MKEVLSAKMVMESFQSGWNPNSRIVIGRGGSDYRPRPNQHPPEITEFVDDVLTILPVERRKQALEIGLETGGTHLIFRQVFEDVMSVEVNFQSAMLFVAGLVDPSHSKMVCSNSQLPMSGKIVEKELAGKKVDMLLIDADHSFHGCESDYLNYEPLVMSGGIVAFHDTVHDAASVGVFVKMIEEGKHLTSTGKLAVKYIHHNGQGIAYYVKP